MRFKKIASVLASAAMLVGITAAPVAMATTYPQPFVSESGVADVAIVYGSHAAAQNDLAAAVNVQNSLKTFVVTGASTSGSTVEGGDFIQLSKSTDEFNLGDNLNSFYTTIDSDELENVLSEGVYRNDDNDEYEYEQEVRLGSMTLQHFTDNDFNDEKPVIGFNLPGGQSILNYTLDFTPDNAESEDADWDSLEGTTIEILGKEYYILSASNSTGSESLELLDSASDTVLYEGETVTVEAGSNTYEVSISIITTDSVRLTVNGETTPSLNEDETYKLDSGDYVGIKEINTQDYQGGIKQVEFSIGSGKIELTNGEEVQVNGEDVSDLDEYDGHVLNAFITQNNGDLDSFTIEWKLDGGNSGDAWLAFGTDSTELIMPVFNNLKLSLGNFVTDAQEMTSIDPDGDDSFTLDTTLTDGDVSFNLLYANSTGTGFDGLGESSTQRLVTNSTANPSINWDSNSAYFVATWIDGDDHESYLLEVSEIDDTNPADNTTTIRSLASGSNQAVTLDIGESDQIGEITFELVAANEQSETATIALSGNGGTVTADKVVTAEGLKIQLPYIAANSGDTADGAINVNNLNATGEDDGTVADPTSWTMNFTEETESGNINEGESFTIVLGFNDDETTVSSVSVTGYETTDGSDDYVGYVSSDLATMTMFATGSDQDSLDITYHGTEAYAEVFLSELGTTLGGGSNMVGVPVTDAESSMYSGKNLVVVGGSCVNSVAAELLGSSTPLCGSAWTEKTGIGANQYLIQTFARTGGNVATLVAGWGMGDTANAATALTTKDVDTSVGMKYTGSTVDDLTSVLDSV